MNWKNIFSLPKRKKARAKVIDQLNQQTNNVDASQITGGVAVPPEDPGIGWMKETSGSIKT